MKFLNSQFAILVMAKATLGRDCALCPNGISSPDKIALQGELTCGELETGYKNQPVDVCNSIKGPIAEDCCPDQIDTLFMDNACGWCPNGISDPDLEVEFPMGSTDMFSWLERSQQVARSISIPSQVVVLEMKGKLLLVQHVSSAATGGPSYLTSYQMGVGLLHVISLNP
eukprot:scaffold24303_cov137-Cylindrotheca_fusiformis.AAC.5